MSPLFPLSAPACNDFETFAGAKVRKKSDICKKDVKIFAEGGGENAIFKGKAAYDAGVIDEETAAHK